MENKETEKKELNLEELDQVSGGKKYESPLPVEDTATDTLNMDIPSVGHKKRELF